MQNTPDDFWQWYKSYSGINPETIPDTCNGKYCMGKQNAKYPHWKQPVSIDHDFGFEDWCDKYYYVYHSVCFWLDDANKNLLQNNGEISNMIDFNVKKVDEAYSKIGLNISSDEKKRFLLKAYEHDFTLYYNEALAHCSEGSVVNAIWDLEFAKAYVNKIGRNMPKEIVALDSEVQKLIAPDREWFEQNIVKHAKETVQGHLGELETLGATDLTPHGLEQVIVHKNESAEQNSATNLLSRVLSFVHRLFY